MHRPHPIKPTAAALALSLCACTTYAPAHVDKSFSDAAHTAFVTHKPLVIYNNFGGKLGIPLAATRILMRKGLEVEIIAECGSACTLLLAEPKGLCYHPETLFGFHSPATPTAERNIAARKAMLSVYPPKLTNWLITNKALESTTVTYLSGNDLAKLDYPREFCSSHH